MADNRRRFAALKAAQNVPPLPMVGGPRLPTGAVGRAIVAVCRAQPGRAFLPREIAFLTKRPQKTIRKEIIRLLQPGKDDTPPPLQRVEHGMYRAFLTHADLARIENPAPNVHALQLVWKLPPYGGSPPLVTHAPATYTAPGQVGRQRDLWGVQLQPRPGWLWRQESKSWEKRAIAQGHNLTIQHYPSTGTVLASINSSRDPFDANGLQRLRDYLSGIFAAEEMPWIEPQVVTVEINRDFKLLRLRGREAARFYLGRMGTSGDTMRFKELQGALVQLYQKKELGVLREEIRINPVELDLANLQAIVTSFFYGPAQAAPPADPGPAPSGGEEPGGYA